ncbi:YceD family protein [Moorella sulfitireducens]|uniref:YceD family protein n=1 Tax=Neomoorella sulfitireducens TaxID=2972948 RepID=UPI0021AC1EB9
MKIGVGDLKARPGGEIEFKSQEKWTFLSTVSGNIPIVAPVRVTGRVTNTGKILLVQGQAATTLELTCDRCLEKYRYPVVAPLEEEYAGTTAGQDANGEKWDKVEVRPLEGDFIDLKPAVEEALILALPMKWLCRENCRGLCPHCGQNLNESQCRCDARPVDPRLAVLGELLHKKEGEN